MSKKKKPQEHPALALMRYEANGFLTSFETDLSTHDANALARVPHGCAFGWILRPSGTHLAICNGYLPEFAHQFACPKGYAVMVIRAFGPDNCRFYFWDGYALRREQCAADLDERTRGWEEAQRERYEAGQRADRGLSW